MKDGWEIKLLTDVAWFQEGPGVRNTQYTETGVKLLNVANLVNGKVDLSTSKRFISEDEAYGRYKHFLVDEGDLIIASSGIQVSYFEKKMGFIDSSHLPLCMNTSTIRFKALNDSTLNLRYLMYYLKSNDFKLQLQRQITGSAQLNFGPSHLKRMHILIPSVAKQEQIVHELDLLSSIIENKNAQLSYLDALAQSVFYEMFGDPSAAFYNQCDSSRKIGDFSKCIAGATPSTKVDSYWSNGTIPWLSSGEVAKGRVFSTETMITQEGYDSCSTRLVPKGSVLVAMAGQGKTRGTVGISGIELCTNQSICSIVVNDKIILPDFLYYQLKLLYNELRSISNGDGGRGGLNLKLIQGFSVIVPEIEKQKGFVKRAKVIETQKNLIQNSIVQSQKLLNSRMSQYFG